MLELLSYGFMQRAIIASIVIGLLCSVIGVFVVLRGLSFVGAGTSHAAFAGVTLAYLIGVNPLIIAIIFSLVTIWIIYLLEEKGRMKLDVSMGIFYTLTMALAVLFIGFMRVYNAELYGYLFGSILSVTRGDLAVILILGIVVISAVFLFYKELHFIVFDPEMAEASGIPAKLLLFLLLNLIALTIVVSLKSVGTLLVFALIIIPASAAYQMAKTMKWMMIYSIIMGIFSSLGGLFISFWFDLPSGAT
ncbi:MAG: metal ABC transporter permease, partial [Nitrospirota bacterium]